MQIVKTARFFDELEEILDFIARDSFIKAEKFANELDEQVFSLPSMPFKCRPSLKSEIWYIKVMLYTISGKFKA